MGKEELHDQIGLGRWVDAADEYDVERLREILQIKTAMVKSQLSESFDYNDFPFLTKEDSDIFKMVIYEQSAELSQKENMEDIINLEFVIENYECLHTPNHYDRQDDLVR